MGGIIKLFNNKCEVCNKEAKYVFIEINQRLINETFFGGGQIEATLEMHFGCKKHIEEIKIENEE